MIGNNRHSDRTFVSEHICIRLALFAGRVCSSSPSLSPSLFLFLFLLSLSPTLVLSFTRSSRLALPYLVSAFTVLRSLSNHTSVCFSFRNFPLALSRNTSSLLFDIVLRRTSGVASLRLRASSRSLSVFSFHTTVSFSVSLSPGWSMLFFHPSAWLAHRFVSVSPWRILFRRCLYIATGWYAGAYIIRRARVRVYVQGFARQHTYIKLPRYVCISVVERPSLARSSWECIQGNIAYTCANWFRYACTREMRKNGRMYRLVLSVYRDAHVHSVWHPCIKCAHACVTRTGSVEDLPSFLRAFFSYRSTLKYAPIDFYCTLPNHRSHAVALLVHAL